MTTATVAASAGPAPLPPAPVRQRIAHVELLAVLHAGGAGVVYRGWDHALARSVMVEEYVPVELVQRAPDGHLEPRDPAAAEAFERGRRIFVERTRLQARCEHPSLSRVLHLLEGHGTAWRVLPWPGWRPVARLQGEAPADDPPLRRWLAELLGALEAYHRLGGRHGGVQAERVLVGPDGSVLLLGPQADPREPAVPAGGAVRADLQDLAWLIRGVVTGEPAPPPGATGVPEPLAAVLERVFHDRPPPRLDERLLRTLDDALSPDPARWPASATAWRQALDGAPARGELPTLFERLAAQAPARLQPAAAPPGARRPPPQPEAAGPVPLPGAAPPLRPATAAAPASPAALPPKSAPPTETEDEVDAATTALIQRVIDAVPGAPMASAPAASAPTTVSAWPSTAAPWSRPAESPRIDLPPGRAGTEPGVRHGPPRAAAAAGARRMARPSRVPAWAWLLPLVVAAALAFAWVVWERNAGARPAPPRPDAMAGDPVPDPLPAPAAGVVGSTARPGAAGVEPPPEGAGPDGSPPPAPAEPPPERAAAPLRPDAAPPAARDRAAPDSPRAACGARTEFALYRCMQRTCSQGAWWAHPQCVRLRETDRVG